MSDQARSLVQQQFGTHAQGYVASPTHRAGYSLDRIVEWAAIRPGQNVLDLATGGGHTALAVARAGAHTVAGDLTMPMLQAAREHVAQAGVSIAFVQLDAEQIPFPAASFDAVTCRIAPHHFSNVAQFVRECARVVKPGGVVAVIDQLAPPDPRAARYTNNFERLRDPSHQWAYNAHEWQGFFTDAGLTIEHYEDFDTCRDLTPWAERMGCDAATITRLRVLLQHAPEPVAAWMKPELTPTADARFVIRQFLLVGRKAD